MVETLGNSLYSNAPGVWSSGPQCVLDMKSGITAANASRPEGSNATYTYLNVDGVTNTVVSLAFAQG
jgi:hypothetical protein